MVVMMMRRVVETRMRAPVGVGDGAEAFLEENESHGDKEHGDDEGRTEDDDDASVGLQPLDEGALCVCLTNLYVNIQKRQWADSH